MASEHAPRSLFGSIVQPEAISLFSSTSSDPFALWTSHQDTALPEDSGIWLVIDETDKTASNDPDLTHASFVLRSEQTIRGSSSDPVLHIQSPAIRGTFIRSPPDESAELGIELPHLTFQLRAIGGARPFCLEIGIKDDAGRRAAIRVSSFQGEPRLYLGSCIAAKNAEARTTKDAVALLHLPLTMAAHPDQDETSLTAWQVLTLPLDGLAKHLSDGSLASLAEVDTARRTQQFGRFHSVLYVKVYANIRLRRVWLSRHLPDHDLAEFQLFS